VERSAARRDGSTPRPGGAAACRCCASAGGPELPSAAAVEREKREEARAHHFFIACLLAALAPICFYPARPLTVVLPAAPAAALLCGRLLDHLLEDPRRLARAVTRSTLTLALAGAVAAVAFVALATRVREAAPDLRLLGAALLVVSWAPFLADLLRRRRVAVLLMALPLAVGMPIVALRVLPAMEDWLNAARGRAGLRDRRAAPRPARVPWVRLRRPCASTCATTWW